MPIGSALLKGLVLSLLYPYRLVTKVDILWIKLGLQGGPEFGNQSNYCSTLLGLVPAAGTGRDYIVDTMWVDVHAAYQSHDGGNHIIGKYILNRESPQKSSTSDCKSDISYDDPRSWQGLGLKVRAKCGYRQSHGSAYGCVVPQRMKKTLVYKALLFALGNEAAEEC